ncbi:ribosome silencing factor [Dethiothermospora halolimnae]|uniref:ribosome silencing factor n=1 Tax=Dethiothermospora halolimnae TaxID=3114390 RepID=UPI003CCBE721
MDNNKLSIIVKGADDKKAFDIKTLKISGLTSIGDYFVIASGNSDRQVISIANEIEDKMHEAGYEPMNKEGYKTGRWILLDYGDIIVHVFHKEDREFYNLERLWVDAEGIELDDII